MSAGAKTRMREPAAMALAGGQSVAEVAALTSVSERQLYRWLADDKFRARVRQHQDEMIGAAAGRLAAGMTKAASVLTELLTSRNERVRLKAASELIAAGLKVAEVRDLARQVEEMAAKFAEFKRRHKARS
jgi:transposase-like protein